MKVVSGDPDPKHVSTSYVERQNLTMRMHMRRCTRLTNVVNKKFQNDCHMVTLYAVWYKFIWIHKSVFHERRIGWYRGRMGSKSER